MDFGNLSSLLTSIEDNNVYLRFEPEILDFTDPDQVCELQFFSSQKQFKLTLSQELFQNEQSKLVFEMLRQSLFSKGKKVLVWNWKSLASFILGRTRVAFSIDAAIVDLKILEYYAGKRQSAPKSLPEALNRLKALITSGIWKEIEPIYKKVHLPLMTTVLPHLETVGINSSQAQEKLFAHYELEGQENGRLKCFNAYRHSFVPHAMTPEFRDSLKPNKYEDFFMSFDFKGMEVYMLAWMSKDPVLMRLCNEQDIYVALYKEIFKKECQSKTDREFSEALAMEIGKEVIKQATVYHALTKKD